MERTNTAVLNGRKPQVEETEEQRGSGAEGLVTKAPEVIAETTPAPAPKPATPKRPVKGILAVLGVGAIAGGGTFGYNWWRYASSYPEFAMRAVNL